MTTAKLATKAATGPKIDEAAFLTKVFTGRNGAGACTLTGAKVGDKVIGLGAMAFLGLMVLRILRRGSHAAEPEIPGPRPQGA